MEALLFRPEPQRPRSLEPNKSPKLEIPSSRGKPTCGPSSMRTSCHRTMELCQTTPRRVRGSGYDGMILNPLWYQLRDRTDNQRGCESEPNQIFFRFRPLSQSTLQNAETHKCGVLKPTAGWMFSVMTREHSRTLTIVENQP